MSRTFSGDHVIAVIVTFHPDPAALRRLIERLRVHVRGAVIVDNSSNNAAGSFLRELPSAFVTYLGLGDNKGVAYALNRGVELAFRGEATHVLLFDQDSLPADDMTQRLFAAHRSLLAAGYHVAAVGPRYTDPRSGYVAPFMATKGLRLSVVLPETPSSPVEVDFLITSGSLISRPSWYAIGPMEEPMFIDYVDVEWGLRARSKGFSSFGVPSASLAQRLGDRRMDFLGLSVPIHNPLRHYYQIRNPIWLYRKSWIPLNWKLVDGGRLILRFAFYALFVAPRIRNALYMFKGVQDGLSGRLGRYRD